MNIGKLVVKYGIRKSIAIQGAISMLRPLLSNEDWNKNKEEIFNLNPKCIEVLRIFILCGISLKTSINIFPHLESYLFYSKPIDVAEAAKSMAVVLNVLNK